MASKRIEEKDDGVLLLLGYDEYDSSRVHFSLRFMVGLWFLCVISYVLKRKKNV